MTFTRSMYKVKILNKLFVDPWLFIFLYTFLKFIRGSLGDFGVGASYMKENDRKLLKWLQFVNIILRQQTIEVGPKKIAEEAVV